MSQSRTPSRRRAEPRPASPARAPDLRWRRLACVLALPAFLAAGARAQTVPLRAHAPILDLFHLPTVGGSFRYSVSAGERFTLGYNGDNADASSSTISGDVAYLSSSQSRPFSLVYSGGFIAGTGAQTNQFFQNLALSQVIDTRNWTFSVADTLNYLPQTPTTGLSGLQGLGDLGASTQGSPDEQDSLTTEASRVNNSVSGTAERKLTGKTTVEGSAQYGLLRFLGSAPSLESNQAAFSGGMSHRLDARTSVNGSYNYSRFTYVGLAGGFVSQGVSVGYFRQLTRKLHTDLAAGPQRVSASTLTGAGPSLSYTADLSLTYAAEFSSLSANYTRATNGGSGLTAGSRTDTLGASYDRKLTRVLGSAVTASYNRSDSLDTVSADALNPNPLTGNALALSPLNTQAFIVSAQANRTLGRSASIYVSYSAQRQILSGNDHTGLALNGTTQTIGFGITYSPALEHLSRP